MNPRLRAMPIFAVVLAACGGGSGPAPAPRAAPIVIATPRLFADDLEVAKVNGRPVWSSCVAAQAKAIPATSRTPDQRRAEALDQCIAFELLAQAADARGLAAATEVADATRAASVNRLVATDFEERYRTPDDLKSVMDLVMKRNERRMHTAPMRSSTFARFVVPKDAPPELDARAHALADRLAQELAGETGLFNVHLTTAAARIIAETERSPEHRAMPEAQDQRSEGSAESDVRGGRMKYGLPAGSDVKLETADIRPMHHDDLVDPYAEALYAIPEVGRIAPAVRTPWGWDVVLWTGGVQPKETSREELVAELFPEVRRRQFQLWVTQLGKRLGVHIEIDPAAASKLDTEGSP
jgi:hypothetical protein